MSKAKQLADTIILNNKNALIALLQAWGYEPRVNYLAGAAAIDTLELIYDLAWIASTDKQDTPQSVACMLCDKWQPPRKAVTSVADSPVCEQCAREYQEAEDRGDSA